MNILFVCKYNRFRSKVAEAFFNKLNKNSFCKTKTAGIFKATCIGNELRGKVKQFGISIKEYPKCINAKLLNWQDIIIVVADDVPSVIFKEYVKKKLIIWGIPNLTDDHDKKINKIIKLIRKRVSDLVKELG